MSSHRFLTRPIAAAIVVAAAAALAPTKAVRAADWQDWVPLADRYQGGVDYRVRPASSQIHSSIDVQFRNHYAQRVTVTMVVLGIGQFGDLQRAPLTQVLEAGDPHKPKESTVVRMSMASLTSVSVTTAVFDGTPPTPTPEGQPGNIDYLRRLLASAQADLAIAENELHESQSQVQATDSALSTRGGPSGGGAGAQTSLSAGDLVAANDVALGASARVAAAQERINSIQRQIKTAEANPGADSTQAAPSASGGFTLPAGIEPAKPLTAKDVNVLLDFARQSVQAEDWDTTAAAFQYVLTYGRSILKDGDRARIDSSMGAALANSGRDTEAEAALRESIRLDPNSANTQDTLGVVLMHEQRYADAVLAFTEAVRLDPKSDLYTAHLKEAQEKAKIS
jgi:hypothetical protein